MTVNISVHQLADPGFPDVVPAARSASGVPAAALCLELTETALMVAGDGSLDVLRALKALGVYISVETQLARRPLLGGWSLSGAAMAGVFPTCGVAHLIAGLTVTPDLHMMLFALADWNRRPLVGRASATSRHSPWAAVPAE